MKVAQLLIGIWKAQDDHAAPPVHLFLDPASHRDLTYELAQSGYVYPAAAHQPPGILSYVLALPIDVDHTKSPGTLFAQVTFGLGRYSGLSHILL